MRRESVTVTTGYGLKPGSWYRKTLQLRCTRVGTFRWRLCVIAYTCISNGPPSQATFQIQLPVRRAESLSKPWSRYQLATFSKRCLHNVVHHQCIQYSILEVSKALTHIIMQSINGSLSSRVKIYTVPCGLSWVILLSIQFTIYFFRRC